jgi:riboflavin kinase/FMN adenylyltransferase
MRLFRSYLHLPDTARGAVMVLGNFDGLHRGHQALIARGRSLADELGVPLGVLTFEPHPRSVFHPDGRPFRLTPFRIKERQLEALGLDLLVVAHFDDDFRRHSAEWFIQEVLIDGVELRHAVAGDDFRFGCARTGDVALLEGWGRRAGFGVTILGPVTDPSGLAFSSTRVRDALIGGRPREAAHVLGRPWEIEGRVEQGDRLGRTLGFPTANLGLGDYLRPAFGVYAVRAGVDGGHQMHWHHGVANLGHRPTVGGVVERLEVHLFDFAEDLYGRHLRVQLIEFLRPEQRFAGLEALKAQIAHDAAAARRVLDESVP